MRSIGLALAIMWALSAPAMAASRAILVTPDSVEEAPFEVSVIPSSANPGLVKVKFTLRLYDGAPPECRGAALRIWENAEAMAKARMDQQLLLSCHLGEMGSGPQVWFEFSVPESLLEGAQVELAFACPSSTPGWRPPGGDWWIVRPAAFTE